MAPVALDSTQLTKIGIGVIIALIVLGALLSLVVTAIVGRLLILVVVVVLGAVVWQQRTTIQHRIDDCKLDATFFGVHVAAPKDVVKACKTRARVG